MNNYHGLLLHFFLCTVFGLLCFEPLSGQSYAIGDLYTFEDGTKGIIFSINPENPRSGTVVALNDIEGKHALYTGSAISELSLSTIPSFSQYRDAMNLTWPDHAMQNTLKLKASGHSPAIEAIDTEHGWYLPDLLQLYSLVLLYSQLQPAFLMHGGDLSTLLSASHMSSTFYISQSIPSNSKYYYLCDDMVFNITTFSTANKIRAVRDFPEHSEVEAFWIGNYPKTDTTVSPDFTSTFNAAVRFNSDTLELASTVTVHEPDTFILQDTTCVSHLPYASPFSPLFDSINVSLTGNYTITKRLQTSQGCDSTVILNLTVLPNHESFDTLSICLYGDTLNLAYEGEEHITLTIENDVISIHPIFDDIDIEEVNKNIDFLIKKRSLEGCDRLLQLHIESHLVPRDTTYYDIPITQIIGNQLTICDRTIPDISGPGTYIRHDTLAASNGCDSIVVTVVVVEPLHEVNLCERSLTDSLTWHDNLGDFQWNGQPLPDSLGISGYHEFHGLKVVEGMTIDTVSYLHLTINQPREVNETISVCLYGEAMSILCDQLPGVTIDVTAEGVVSVSSSDSVVTVLPVPGSDLDFVLRTATTNGCDNIVRLHVDARPVARDTLVHEIPVSQVIGGAVTVEDRTIPDISGPGTYIRHDTLAAGNGCDSIVVTVVVVNSCTTTIQLNCPPDIHDTLDFGDCVTRIHPERDRTVSIYHTSDWPIVIFNDMPADSLFTEGEHLITWIATDTVCGGSDTCTQWVVIASPPCPDAIDCEGNIYHGVRIGCDCWTQRNLESTRYSDCTPIPETYAYASLFHPDTAENVAIYGRLYGFEAAIRDGADNGHGHIQGICPDGWYLPTPEKYESLNAFGADALRSPMYWIDGGGSNSSGFTALPAGFYNGEKDRYEGLLTETFFWSTKRVGNSVIKDLYTMRYECDKILQDLFHHGLGYSVRCIKERERE